ncbi:unnamed protein product [Dovyalis caffra]|uniref:Uncharacterized protein n=1 Tax=Dovyalis caffra TaxID=77055 RepID=A0AAV1SSP9_9ROSI|nr:unnamed protein product [Dovyalis caffra]
MSKIDASHEELIPRCGNPSLTSYFQDMHVDPFLKDDNSITTTSLNSNRKVIRPPNRFELTLKIGVLKDLDTPESIE